MRTEYELSSSSLYKLKEIMKDLVTTIDTLNYDIIDSSFFKKSAVENVFKAINRMYSQFDANKNKIRYVNRIIFPNIMKFLNKINERCRNDVLKLSYIRRYMIPQVLSEVHYLYDLCESKPFDYEVKFMEQFVIPLCLKMFSSLYKTFGEFSTEKTSEKENMSIIMKECDYHGHLSWSRDLQCFFFVPHIRRKPKHYVDEVCGPEHDRLLFGGNYFASCLDGFHILHFLNNFQLEATELITLQYVKFISLYTVLIKIPIAFIHFFFTETVDEFLRSILVYFQYYLQIWDIAEKRAEMRKIKLPHSNSDYYESIWQNNLNDLRYFVARNYCSIILGNKDLINFHHLNSPKGINTTTDYLLYELLYDFSAKIVILILNHENDEERNNVIKNEVNRLFREKVGGHEKNFQNIAIQERKVLSGKFRIPKEWRSEAPCLAEIKRPGRDDRIYHIGTKIIKTRDLRLRIFQAALLIPEESLTSANMRIGILGKPKKNYPPLLTCYQLTRSENRKKKETRSETISEIKSSKIQHEIKETSNCDIMKRIKDMLKEEVTTIDSIGKEEDSRMSSVDVKREKIDMGENDEQILTEDINNTTKCMVAIELFTLLLYMKKERHLQMKQRRFIRKMKKRYAAEKIVGGSGTFLVQKEYLDQPYCLSYKLMNRSKAFDREEAVALWTKYACSTKRFFYRIDPFSTIVDEYSEEQ